MQETPRLVIAGTRSGSGKTTLVAGLAALFKKKGFTVQAFKVGPDYLDPTYHTLATGRPCRNLDLWLTPPRVLRASFWRACQGTDLALVEGVMGLYDGSAAGTSTAKVARLLRAPVLLVLDAAHLGESAAAVVLGFQKMEHRLQLAGVVLNGVGSSRHQEILVEAIVRKTGLPVLGSLPREEELALPARHLGLVPAGDREESAAWLSKAASFLKSHLDVAGILRAARQAPPLPWPVAPTHASRQASTRVPVALARDHAFNFYYQDALEYLEELGAELLPFSPLEGEGLPKGSAGLLLGGGYPEVFATRLSQAGPLARELHQAAAEGMPVYAECGGLLFLCRSLLDGGGKEYPMAGLIPARARLGGRLAGLGYRTGTLLADGPLGRAGGQARGHEFHYSYLEPLEEFPQAFLLEGGGRSYPEGYLKGALHASYLHLHWAGCPKLARQFLAHCRDFQKGGA